MTMKLALAFLLMHSVTVVAAENSTCDKGGADSCATDVQTASLELTEEDTELQVALLQTGIAHSEKFLGDSDIEYWKSEDNFPDALNCGVGGSTAYEAAMHAQKTANKFEPKGHVVMVAGEDDMKSALECPDTNNLKTAALAFVNSRYHPTVIMFSTKPEPGTTELHSLYRKYDKLLLDWAETPEMKGHFKFIHAHALFNAMGNPANLYDSDDLHMSQTGYGHWNTWLHEVIKDGCHDYLGKDGQVWKDSGGYTCQTYSSNDWCATKGDEYKVDGAGSNQACCACGGGRDDIAKWKNSDGDDCTKVVTDGNCVNADDYKVKGVGAKEACVGCGGGVKRQPLL